MSQKKMIALHTIKRNEDNPRKIDVDKLKKLKKSIEEFSQMMELRPIVVDNHNIILGGNMRYQALIDLGYKEVNASWIKKASNLTNEEKKRFIIADNVGFGDWDWQILEDEWDMEELASWGLESTRWDTDDSAEDDEETDIGFSYQLVVELEDEEQQEKLFNELQNKGYICKVLTL